MARAMCATGVIAMVLAGFIAGTAPGDELGMSSARLITGGTECGDAYAWNDEIKCTQDEVFHCNGEDKNCNTASYSGYESTGSGDRAPGQTKDRICTVCTHLCQRHEVPISHVAAGCSSF